MISNTNKGISGSLIVSETIFGLFYSFIFQQRLPFLNEWIAIILLIGSVIITIRSQNAASL
jgi:drug/metabolite transporter (DMT)-like permease